MRKKTSLIGNGSLMKHLTVLLDSQALPRLILFYGPPSVGKATGALWLAQYQLCQAPNKPCHTCPNCQMIENNRHPSCLIFNDGADQSISVEQVRQALRNYQTVNWDKSDRWLIITDVERLTEAAANTLLKFLEELPPGVRVILTTAAIDRVLSTIISRATVYYWHLAANQEIAALTNSTDRGETRLVNRAAGRAGLYRKYLDQPELLAREIDEVLAVLDNIAQQKSDTSSAETDQIKADVRQRLNLLELVMRELLLTKSGATERNLWPQLSNHFRRLADQITWARLISATDRLLNRYQFSNNIQPRLLYEDQQMV